VGGTRQCRFDGTNCKPQKLPACTLPQSHHASPGAFCRGSAERYVSPLFGTFIPIWSVCSSRLEKLVAAKLLIVSLPELLGEPDEKSFGATDVAEPIRVLVLNYFTDELRAALEEPGERLVDVVHGEHDA
jgi:hypothetical protein